MADGIRTGDPHGFNKGRSLKFCEGSRVRQLPEEGWRTYWPKHYGNNNKDEDNSPNTLNDKNHQTFSQKFKQPNSNKFKIFVWYIKHELLFVEVNIWYPHFNLFLIHLSWFGILSIVFLSSVDIPNFHWYSCPGVVFLSWCCYLLLVFLSFLDIFILVQYSYLVLVFLS